MMWQYTRRDTKILLVATLLLFSGYALLLVEGWRSIDTGTQQANTVGVFVGVPENEINSLAMQLDARAQDLDRREALLAQSALEQRGADAVTLFVVTVVGGALLGLILLNFYLDSRRRYVISQ